MDDIDRVFAHFKDDKTAPADRRETLSIPRRNGTGGSRTVEVVHLRSRGASNDHPQRLDSRVRAASWEGGFQAKPPAAKPVLPAPVSVTRITPTTHVMPAWKPAGREGASPAPVSPASAEVSGIADRRGRGRPRKEISETSPIRRIADPFDADDDGANCLRCGYAIERDRDRRGLTVCSACG